MPNTASNNSRSANADNRSLETETLANILKIASIEEQERAKRTIGEKIAETIARFCGSMTFVYVHIVWFVSWVIVNSVKSTQFDPFPYTFLTLVVSLEAIFLSTFILISQNHDTQLSERRNHLDLQVNILAEKENTKMLQLLHQVARKVGVYDNDPETEALLQPMEPERLVEQITKATSEEMNQEEAP